MTDLTTAWIIAGAALVYWANSFRRERHLAKDALVYFIVLVAGFNLLVAWGKARPYCDDPERDTTKVCVGRPQ
jgi:hypothetical protein